MDTRSKRRSIVFCIALVLVGLIGLFPPLNSDTARGFLVAGWLPSPRPTKPWKRVAPAEPIRIQYQKKLERAQTIMKERRASMGLRGGIDAGRAFAEACAVLGAAGGYCLLSLLWEPTVPSWSNDD